MGCCESRKPYIQNNTGSNKGIENTTNSQSQINNNQTGRYEVDYLAVLTVDNGTVEPQKRWTIDMSEIDNVSVTTTKIRTIFNLYISVISFDLICQNFYSSFFSDPNIELCITYENLVQLLSSDNRPKDVDLDEDYLNRSGTFENFNKRKNTGQNKPSSNTSQTFKIKKFTFPDTINIKEDIIDITSKDSYIHFAVMQKYKKATFTIGEGYLPINFLYCDMKEVEIEVSIFNIFDDLLLGNLYLKVSAFQPKNSESVNINESYKSLFNLNKMHYLFVADYSVRDKFKYFGTKLKSIDLNSITLTLVNILDSYFKGNKEFALRILFDFLSNIINVSEANEAISSNSYNLKQSEKHDYTLDFNTLVQIRYYLLLFLLNEIIVKSDTDPAFSEKLTMLINSRFLEERILYSLYSRPVKQVLHVRTDAENKFNNDALKDNLILLECYFHLLLNSKKYFNNILNQNFKIASLLKDYISYYKKCLIDCSKRTNSKQTITEKSFTIKRNLIYLFLRLIKNSLDMKYSYLVNMVEKKEKVKKDESQDKTQTEILENINYDLEALKLNCEKFFMLRGKGYEFCEKDLEFNTIICSLMVLIVKNSKIFCYVKQINKTEYYLDYFLNRSDFLNWLRRAFESFYEFPKFYNIVMELIYELFTDASGVFVFNFFKKIDFKLLVKGFNVDAKNASSITFYNRYYYYSVLNKLADLIKPDSGLYSDFMILQHDLLAKNVLGAYEIISKNGYFKIFDEIDLEYKECEYLRIVATESKFMRNKNAVKIQTLFFEILSKLTFSGEAFEIILKSKVLNKILTRIIFFTLVKTDEYLADIFKAYNNIFFTTYCCFVTFCLNLNKQNGNLKLLLSQNFKLIFSNNNSNKFNYEYFIAQLEAKILQTKYDKCEYQVYLNNLKLLQ
jgi:hypothetical protein